MNDKRPSQSNLLRLDSLLFNQGHTSTRSQAETYIKLGYVRVNGKIANKAGQKVSKNTVVKITAPKMLVSRAGFKLFSITKDLNIKFSGKVVLDVGSSTGGFSDLALQSNAAKVIAVDVGTEQMEARLKTNKKIELHEQTDIRDMLNLSSNPDIVLIDVSFISIMEVLNHLPRIIDKGCQIVAMVKPQFETNTKNTKSSGVIKNDKIRRQIFKEFEQKVMSKFKIIAKADSKVLGEKGNQERFYLLRLLSADKNNVSLV